MACVCVCVCVCACVHVYVCVCVCVCVCVTHMGGSREEVRMVTALLQVHHDVEQGDRLSATSVQFLKVAGQNPPIVLPIEHTQSE